MLGGAAQMFFFDRVPIHAAIDESVEYVKSHVPKAAAFVNAVLRNLGRAIESRIPPAWESNDLFPRNCVPLSYGGHVRFRSDVLPADPLARLAAGCGCPLALLRHWIALHGENAASALAMHTLSEAPIVLNIQHAVNLPAHAPLRPHAQPGSAIWIGEGGDLAPFLHAFPSVWVQDASSTRAVNLARNQLTRDPTLILDLCAGQGTKARQLAKAFPTSSIVATDIDRRRLQTLRTGFTGESSHRVRVVESTEIATAASQGADLILLDVPCSNSGVLARRPEAQYRWGAAQTTRLVATQREILTTAAAFLHPGGMILYSTCSIDPEENQQQSAWAASLGLHKNVDELTMPVGKPGGDDALYHDGSYAALLSNTPS